MEIHVHVHTFSGFIHVQYMYFIIMVYSTCTCKYNVYYMYMYTVYINLAGKYFIHVSSCQLHSGTGLYTIVCNHCNVHVDNNQVYKCLVCNK